ncbi:MAG: translocation/assembly module TamB domain-containing protein [Gemmatimonadota bacterium]
MTRRFLSRDEWPLIAAGVVAGLLTAAVLVYFFVTGIGGSGPPAPVTPADSAVAHEPAPIGGDQRRAHSGKEEGGPLIGAREAGVERRLASRPVSARPLKGPLTIVLRDVVWNEDSGTRFLRAESARGRLDTRSAQRGDVIISDVVVTRPIVTLREGGSGDWNYEQVFEELLDGGGGAPPGGRRRIVQLHNVRIDNGDVEVSRSAQRFAFRGVEGVLPVVVFSQPGVPEPYLRAADVSARFVQAEPAADLAVQLTDGLFQFPDGTVRFEVASAALADARFASLDGVWDPTEPGYGVTATGTALGVDFADVAFMTPEGFPETGTATFTFAVEPAQPDDTRVTLTELEAESGDSRVLGSFTAFIGLERFELIAADLQLEPLTLALVEDFTGSPLPYGGSVAGSVSGSGGDIAFDLIATLTTGAVPEPFTAGLSGTLLMASSGFVLRQVDVDLDRVPLAALRAFAPALPVGGSVTGRVSLTGPPGEAPLDVDVRLELGAGVALVEGVLDLTGDVPRYDLAGSILGVDLEAVLEPAVPPASLTARFTLAGSGFDPATMNADLFMAGRFTGWQTTADDTLHVVASINSGTLGVETLVASLATADVAAEGDWRFLEPQSGAVTYALSVTSLAPFGPYLPVVADSVALGAIAATGSVAGTLDRMRLAGSASGTEVRVGGWAAGTLAAEYDVLLAGDLPEAVVDAQLTNVVTPTAGSYEEGRLSLRLASPSLTFELAATRDDGGILEVLANGTVPTAGLPGRIVVERARLDLAEEIWSLTAPTEIEWTEDGLVNIDSLLIEAERSDGRIFLAGRILPRGRVDAQFEVAAFPLGDVQRLLGQPVRVDGLLSAEGTVMGGTETPRLDVVFSVDRAAVGQVPLQVLAGKIVYLDRQTRIDARIVVDSAGQLDIEATLPSMLSLGDSIGFRLLDGLPLSGSVTADHFALAPLAAMVPRVREVTGVVNANVTLGGTADAPEVAGTLALVGGSVTVPELNQRYTEITGGVDFDGQSLVITDLRARSDGWAVVGGQIVLERLDEPRLDLTVTLDRFRPIGVDDQDDAAVSGRLALVGGLDAIQLSGGLLVEDGYVEIPQFGNALSAELADITRPFEARPLDEPAAADWLGNLQINDLRVTVGDGAWFVALQARAQLTGELVVNKNGDAMPITGTLQGTRGQYTLVAGPIVRRFEIVAAQVRFRGLPEPNPVVDITARRIVMDPGGRQLDVDVRITGTLDNPTLALAGGGGAVVAESELLSFLLFGRPSFALGGGVLPGEAILQETFFGGAAELLALELERSLGGLGLDIFQVRLGTGPFGGLGTPTFVLGRQIREDVFLTVETGIAALFGSEENALKAWTIRLDWTFDEQSRLRLALEPVYRGRTLRSAGLALPLSEPRPQFLVEVRRRWTY